MHAASALTSNIQHQFCVPAVQPAEAELILHHGRDYHSNQLEVLASELKAGKRSAVETSMALTELRDRIIHCAVEHAFADYGQRANLCLMAIGGSGEKTSCRHSDYDSVWLLRGEDPIKDEEFLSRRHKAYDIVIAAGIKWDHQSWPLGYLPDLSNPREIERLNAVLTRRLIWGDGSVFGEFEEVLRGYLRGDSAAWGSNLRRALTLLEQLNADRFRDKGDDPLALYGDKKNGCGGYRCMTVIRAYAEYARLSGTDGEMDLLREGEWRKFTQAREAVLALRHALHQCAANAGPQADLLTRENEDAVMRAVPGLGKEGAGDEPKRTVFHEKIVSSRRIFAGLLQKIKVSTAILASTGAAAQTYSCLKQIHEDLFSMVGASEVAGTDPYLAHAALAAKCVEAFGAVQRLKNEQQQAGEEERLSLLDQNALFDAAVMAHALMERTAEEAPGVNPFRSFPAVEQFRTIVSGRRFVGETLRSMHEKEVLSLVMPTFGAMGGRVGEKVADHSLDGHALAAVQELDRILLNDEPMLSDCLTSVNATTDLKVRDPSVLYLALLLHDVARAGGAEKDHGEHARRGAAIAREEALALEFSAEQAARVARLVELHPLMMETAKRHMVSKPRVVREFAETVGDADMLTMLLLHTWADKKTSSLSSWMEQASHRHWLGMLYENSLSYLKEGHVGVLDNSAVIKEITRKVVPNAAQSTAAAIVRVYLREHLANLPGHYVEQCSIDEIGDHLQMLAEFESLSGEKNAPVALLKWDFPSGRKTAAEGEEQRTVPLGFRSVRLLLVTRDNPGLFSRICAGLDFNIRGAKIFTRNDGLVCNTFYLDVVWSYRPEDMARQNRYVLGAIAGGDEVVKQVYEKQRRSNSALSYPRMPVEVNYADEDNFTRVEIKAPDQGKLAFALGTAFAKFGLNIQSAKLGGGRNGAEDFFEFDRIAEELRPQITEAIKASIRELWTV